MSTLRYYERRGLLPEPVRGPGGHRRYGEDAVRFVRAVKEAQAVGFTLAEIEEYLRVVRGGRVPAPAALRVQMAASARDDVPELPFLAPALRRLLAELPAPADGLSGTERCALQAIGAGAATPIAAFLAAQDREEAPFLGDAWFFRALAGLGHGANRLVGTRDGAELGVPPPLGDGPSFARQPLRLTPAGHRVLARQADRVTLLGIDRWLGGTHLTPAATWRWDPATQELTRPASG